MNDRETLDIELDVFGKFEPKLSTHSAAATTSSSPTPPRPRSSRRSSKSPAAGSSSPTRWSSGSKPPTPTCCKLLQRIDGLVINDSEAKLLTDTENLVLAGHLVREMGPKFVVIKKGEHGAMFFSEHETYVLPAFPTEKVIDPTGAGDSFAGGMMGYLAAAGQLRTRNAQNRDGLRHPRRQLQRRRLRPGAHATNHPRRHRSPDERLPQNAELLGSSRIREATVPHQLRFSSTIRP